jgi:hypothetical protein
MTRRIQVQERVQLQDEIKLHRTHITSVMPVISSISDHHAPPVFPALRSVSRGTPVLPTPQRTDTHKCTHCLPMCTHAGSDKERMRALAKAADSISTGDLVNSSLRRGNNWSLATAACARCAWRRLCLFCLWAFGGVWRAKPQEENCVL